MIYIIIPAYNESEFIEETLQELHDVMKKIQKNYQIIVVDDGSMDPTAEVVTKIAKKNPLILLKHKKNQGPGRAFLTGLKYITVRATQKDIIITLEADNTNDTRVIPELIKAIENGFNVACASRYLRTGGYRNFPGVRTILSKGANGLLKVLFPIPNVTDYTLFFRSYNSNIIKRALSVYGDKLVEFSGFVGNTEILIKIRQLDIKATEIPTTYEYIRRRGKSRMNIYKNLKDYFMFIYCNWNRR